MELGHDPRDNHGQGGGQDQPRGTAEGTLGDGGEAGEMVARTRLFDGFQCADVAREKGENRHANAALPRNAQNRPLQDSRRRLFGITRSEQIVVPGAGKMGEDDQERRDTSKALSKIQLAPSSNKCRTEG